MGIIYIISLRLIRDLEEGSKVFFFDEDLSNTAYKHNTTVAFKYRRFCKDF